MAHMLITPDEFQNADLSFLSRYPYEAQAEVKALFAAKHLMVTQGWRTAWMSIAALY